ncbi:TPA: sugar ABC transporter [Klebsiella michiganensis]|nr:sugar ABC transporter [Klebsiella michiganensis]
MLYIVECSYADPQSEAGWNRFYSEDKLPALVSVSGFRASQRFRALSSGCPVYLAIHTIEHGDTLASEAYRQKGGGSFSRWQAHIRDWRRNLYRYGGVFPAVAEGDVLLLNPEPLDVVELELGYPPTNLSAAGLDNNPPQRVAYVLPRREAMLLAGRESASMYEPMAAQLQSPTEIPPPSR